MNRFLACLAVVWFSVVFPTNHTEAQTCPVKIGYEPVVVNDLAVTDGYLFLPAGSDGLMIFDTSDPQDLVQVAHWPEIVGGIEIDGDYAFVGSSGPSLVIVDISNPLSPFEVDRIAVPSGWRTHFAISGDYAFGWGGDATLTVVRLFPTMAIVYTDGPAGHRFYDMQTSGDFLFVRDQNGYGGGIVWAGVRIFDISVPQTPVAVDTADHDTDNPIAMTVEGNLLYIAVSEAGQQGKIFEISGSGLPFLVGVFDANGTAIDADGTFLQVFGDSLSTYNVADPYSPVLLGSLTTLGPAIKVVADGDFLYSSSTDAGLEVFNIVNCEWAAKPDCNLDGVVDAADVSCILSVVY